VNPNDTPDFVPASWKKRSKDWQLIKDVYERLANCEISQYLKQAAGETDANFDRRAALAVFDGQYPDAINAHSSLLSEFEVLEDTPEDILTLLEDVDGQGTDLESFSQNADISCLNYGATIIFINPAEGNLIPPRLRLVELCDVRCPRIEMIEGKIKITRLGVKAAVEESDGEFATKVVDKWFVYERGFCQVWIKNEKGQFVKEGEVIAMRGANGQLLTSVPAVWYPAMASIKYFEPPIPIFLTLAQLNIKLLNKTSELDNVETKCNSPTWYKKHEQVPEYPAPLEVGANACIHLRIEEEAGLIEPEGTAIAVTHERIKHLEEKIEKISQAFLTGGETEKTATQAAIESAQSKATLQGVAHQKESAFQQVFHWLNVFTDPNYKEGDPTGGICVSESVLKPLPTAQDVRTIFDGFSMGVYDRDYALAKLREIGWEPEEVEEEPRR
jgi:hypothetical protein